MIEKSYDKKKTSLDLLNTNTTISAFSLWNEGKFMLVHAGV